MSNEEIGKTIFQIIFWVIVGYLLRKYLGMDAVWVMIAFISMMTVLGFQKRIKN